MDHPLVKEPKKLLRGRVIELLREGYNVPRAGNIVFVCGGNDAEQMRPRFQRYCEENVPKYDIFFPEFAMEDYFSGDVAEPFDIADFEEIVGDISHSIVIFPEAPGSFAETGYFAAKKALCSKSILVLDAKRQASDSFISMGPAKIIGETSKFNPVMYLDYAQPDFAAIVERIERHPIAKYKKLLELSTFKDLTRFELMGLIQKVVDLLTIATISDVEFIFRSLFNAQISVPEIRKISSILVGSNDLRRVGDYGHVTARKTRPGSLTVREGYAGTESQLRLQIAPLIAEAEPEFRALVAEAQNAD